MERIEAKLALEQELEEKRKDSIVKAQQNIEILRKQKKIEQDKEESEQFEENESFESSNIKDQEVQIDSKNESLDDDDDENLDERNLESKTLSNENEDHQIVSD